MNLRISEEPSLFREAIEALKKPVGATAEDEVGFAVKQAYLALRRGEVIINRSDEEKLAGCDYSNLIISAFEQFYLISQTSYQLPLIPNAFFQWRVLISPYWNETPAITPARHNTIKKRFRINAENVHLSEDRRRLINDYYTDPEFSYYRLKHIVPRSVGGLEIVQNQIILPKVCSQALAAIQKTQKHNVAQHDGGLVAIIYAVLKPQIHRQRIITIAEYNQALTEQNGYRPPSPLYGI